MSRVSGVAVLASLLVMVLTAPLWGAPPPSTSTNGKKNTPAADDGKPTDYKTAHFLVHTDLPAIEAKDLLDKLETMLGLISKYWGRPPAGVIECFVVKDLSKWPNGSLDPRGRAKIQEGAGVTFTETLSLGNTKVASKSVVYACSEHGTAQHEAVHAYCGQTFGATGPVWYAEGMAEMGQYWRQGELSVQAHPEIIKYLRGSQPKTLNEIVNSREITGDSWQNYAWRWALCHMLANNANYKARFLPLGLGFLNEQPVTFEEAYGAMAEEISFEYLFFLQHVQNGYRADLCSWDWKRKFIAPLPDATVNAVINAGRGWQPSGLTVKSGQAFNYSATGKWQTTTDATQVTAAGDSSGAGKLVGVLLSEFKLSAPFDLGESGVLNAPADGKLYLRCRDEWNKIDDNKGTMTVKFKLAEKKS